ncbi:MAG: mechanosensitive ion channel domain-containing protein [Chloroflexota bacterium]
MPDLTPIQKLADELVLSLPRFIGAIIIFIIFWIIGVLFGRIVKRLGRQAKFDDVVSRVMGDFVRVTVLIIGTITALGTIGIDVSALVTGIGLTSLALGLALQPIVGNAVSGMLILLYRPFRPGDMVKVLDNEGKIINISLRCVTLESENRHILVPNQSMLSNVVVINRASAQGSKQ